METCRLESPRSLRRLYAKALVGPIIPGGGNGLPEQRLELADVEIDRDHLARYDRVCGFRIGDELPATYPHVLAFPLALELMTEREFPFALLGLVHVSNRIDQRRPLRADERFSLAVWAESLRPHRRGRQLDLVAEVSAEGEPAWTGRSTYLRKGGGNDESAASSDERPGDEVDPDVDPAATWKVPGDIGRRYAAVSGDRNPIHLHRLAARAFGFPGAIAHGMWMKARCLAAFEGRLPGACRVDAAFRRPLAVPGSARFASRRDDERWSFVLATPGSGKPCVTGSVEPLR